jgi:hypothetical protein
VEVLVVRVHPENLDRQKLPKEAKGKGVWERRYREINDWERYLADNGFKVVKLFLNLSKEEQRTRFFKRLDLPEKNWKFSAADVRERQRWDDYQKAFSEMLSATSTRWAPWYVIPADRKWFARICTAAVLAHTLMEIDPQYPEVTADRRQELLVVKGELETQAPKGAPADPFAAKAKAKAEAKAEAEGKTADGQSAVPARRASRGRDGAARAGQRAAAPRTPRARSEADGQGQPTRARRAAGGTPSPPPATPSPAPPAQAAPRTTRARTTRTPATPSPASPAPASPRPRRPRPGSQQG